MNCEHLLNDESLSSLRIEIGGLCINCWKERAEKAEAALAKAEKKLTEIAEPQLATHQPCGCQLCVCPEDGSNQCGGCGAHSCQDVSKCVLRSIPSGRMYDDAPSYSQLQAACAELKDALGCLLDLQNGPPLVKWEAEWTRCMERCRKLINGDCGKGWVKDSTRNEK